MNFRYRLSDVWVKRIGSLEEFANGATQVTVRLKNGDEVGGVLISDGTFVIAVRGFDDLPFALEDIADVFQSDADRNPKERGGWRYWDDWRA